MHSFQRILFPVDFSSRCASAALFVREMAARFRSDVDLLHVVELPPVWYGPSEATTFESLVDVPALVAERRARLSQFAAEHFRDAQAQLCVQTGDAGTLIVHYARQRKTELIAMPTHGYGPIRSLLLGSVTAKVLHDTECPVWTVARPEESKRDPAAPWRNLLCAVSAEPKDAALVRFAAELAAEQGAALQLVHVVAGFEPVPDPSEQDPLQEFLFNAAREQIARVQAQVGTNREVRIEAGDVGRTIRDVAVECRADLLLVGRGAIQKRLGRLRSNAYAILRDAPCPVISV